MISETVVEELRTQRVVVDIAAARLGQAGTSKMYRGVWIKALSTNTDPVYIGMDDQAATNGYELLANQAIEIPIDLLEKVWAAAGADGQVLCLLFV